MHQPVPSRRTATLENGTPRATAHTPWPAFIKLRRSGGSARAPHNNDGARALHRELRPVAFTIGYAVRAAPKRLNPSATNTRLLDGILVGCSFPEVVAAMVNNITDADLFLHYLNTNATVTWSDDQIKAATGYPTVTTLSTPEVRNGIFSASPDNHLVFELPEPAFDEALAVTGGVIFGAFRHIAGGTFPRSRAFPRRREPARRELRYDRYVGSGLTRFYPDCAARMR